MHVVWFAEIKWDYLRTRKQQLIARRPRDVDVVFLEPYVRGRRNRFGLRLENGVRVATIPFVKSVPGGIVRSLLDRRVVRLLADRVARWRVLAALRAAGVDPADAVFVISNVYAVHVAASLPRRRLVYDCNDAHADFPGMPPWTRDEQRETFRRADAVVISSRGLMAAASDARGSADAVTLVENGVDGSLFGDGAARRATPAAGAPVRIGYLGAVAPWFDFDLVAALARARPAWEIVIVGPVLAGGERELAALEALPNVVHRPAVAHDAVPGVLAGFTLGIIPFRRTPLTAGVNPNKLYEYLATGLPTVATPFSPDLEPLPDLVAVAPDAGAFVAACDSLLEAARDPARAAAARSRAAGVVRAHDWAPIAAHFWACVEAVPPSS